MEENQGNNEMPVKDHVSSQLEKLIGWAKVVAIAGFIVGGFVTKQEVQRTQMVKDMEEMKTKSAKDLAMVIETDKEVAKILSDFNDWRIALDNTRFYKADGDKLEKAQTDNEKRIQRLEDVLIFQEEESDGLKNEIISLRRDIASYTQLFQMMHKSSLDNEGKEIN